MHGDNFYDLIGLFKEYSDTFNKIYKLKSTDESELDEIYQDIENHLIKPKKIGLTHIADILSIASQYNNRYYKSYLSILKKIYQEHKDDMKHGTSLLSYFVCKEYGIPFNEDNEKGCSFFDMDEVSLDYFEEDSIVTAIRNDDLESLQSIAKTTKIQKHQTYFSFFYPKIRDYTLLDLCAIHGSINCWKFLTKKYKLHPDEECMPYSFLSGVPDIIKDCTMYNATNKECMKHAIISHRMDLVQYLMDKHKIEIDLKSCGCYNNMEAFLLYYDITSNSKECFVNSVWFNTPSICEYFLSKGVDINVQDKNHKTIFYYAAKKNKFEIVEFLLSHGADVNCKVSPGSSALHVASKRGNDKIVEYLISKGADIEMKDKPNCRTPFLCAAIHGRTKTMEILLSHGANINDIGIYTCSALHQLSKNNFSLTSVEFLVSHGANVNIQDKNQYTPLHYAIIHNSN